MQHWRVAAVATARTRLDRRQAMFDSNFFLVVLAFLADFLGLFGGLFGG